jgi:hypothetical protein
MGAALAVIATFCMGLGVAGSPSRQRHIEADRARVQNLRTIANAVFSRQMRTRNAQPAVPLPNALRELAADGLSPAQTIDPETKAPYEYRVKSDSAYELCAVFVNMDDTPQQSIPWPWHHGRGRTCFNLSAVEQY